MTKHGTRHHIDIVKYLRTIGGLSFDRRAGECRGLKQVQTRRVSTLVPRNRRADKKRKEHEESSLNLVLRKEKSSAMLSPCRHMKTL